MKKETKQRLVSWTVVLLVVVWILWPRSLERLILKRYTATDFSAIEQFQVRWTPPNAVQDFDAGAYPSWTMGKDQTQSILEILQKATVSCPTGNRSLVIGEEGNYELVTWCLHLRLTQRGEIQVWNNIYKLDRQSNDALWNILTESNPEQ